MSSENPIMLRTIPAQELVRTNLEGQFTVVDIRSEEEYQNNHIEGAILIPYNELPDRINEIPMQEKVLLYCNNGLRAGSAQAFLMGYALMTNIFSLEGGINSLNLILQAAKAS